MKRNPTLILVNSKTVFIISLLVMFLTIVGVYFWGLGVHHTFFENSIISTSLLSVAFLSYITVGLYKGVKLKDTLGRITDRYKVIDTTNISTNIHSDIPADIGEGIVGLLLGILLWIVAAIVFSLLLWLFTNLLVIVVLIFIAMLYWIFFRSLRVIFKKSGKTKGNLMKSLWYGISYTLLYNFWIFAIFLMINYLKK